MTDTVVEFDWDRALRKAPFVSRKVAREFPGIEAGDIEQEIYLHIANKRASIARTTTSDAGLETIMTRAARQYAARERYTYMHHSSEWIYTPKEVTAIFAEAFFDDGIWENVPNAKDGMTINAQNVVISLWDLSEAYDAVSVEDQTIIAKRFDSNEPLTDSEQRRCRRAIDNVTARVNGRMASKSDLTCVDIDTI